MQQGGAAEVAGVSKEVTLLDDRRGVMVQRVPGVPGVRTCKVVSRSSRLSLTTPDVVGVAIVVAAR